MTARAPESQLFEYLHDLIETLPVITPTNPDPPFYEELGAGPEFDLGVLARLYTRVPHDPQIADVYARLVPWMHRYGRLSRTAHDLCFEMGVATGMFEDTTEQDERVTAEIEVLYAARWEHPTRDDEVDEVDEVGEPTFSADVAHLDSDVEAEIAAVEPRAAVPVLPNAPGRRRSLGMGAALSVGATLGALFAAFMLRAPTPPRPSEPAALASTDERDPMCSPATHEVAATAARSQDESLDLRSEGEGETQTVYVRYANNPTIETQIDVTTRARTDEHDETSSERVITLPHPYDMGVELKVGPVGPAGTVGTMVLK